MNACGVVVATAMLPLILAAQTPSPGLGQIRAESRAVSIDVLVRDKETGVPIGGLTAAQFTVRDEGRVQKLSAFSAGKDTRPLALAIVVESNALTRQAAPLLASAARPAFERLRPDDEVMILRLWPGAHIVQDLTRDRDAAARGLESVAAEQQAWLKRTREERQASRQDRKTAMNDMRVGVSTALMLAAQQIHSQRPDARAVIVVLTADLNIVPARVVAETAEHLIASDVSVYGLIDIEHRLIGGVKTLIHVMDSRPDTHMVQRDETVASYSQQTGGALYDVKGGDFGAALGEVFRDLAASYSLAFVPDSQRLDGKFHSLEVEVHTADNAAARVSARKRYWASAGGVIVENAQADPAPAPKDDTSVPIKEGLYYRSADSWMRLEEAGIPQWKVTGVVVAALTYGIKRPSFLQEYHGARARQRIDGANPIFMLRWNTDPQDLRLAILGLNNGDRVIDVAGIFDIKGRKEIPLKIERVASGLFRIVPSNALQPDEYLLGMNDLAAPAWDFGFSGSGK